MKFRTLFKTIAVVSTFLSTSLLVASGVNDFTGSWTNPTPNGGLKRLVVRQSGDSLTMQVFNVCGADECDLGQEIAIAFAPNVSANASDTAKTIMTNYQFGHAIETLIAERLGNRLRVRTFVQFTDGSGRSNYVREVLLNPMLIAPFPGLCPDLTIGVLDINPLTKRIRIEVKNVGSATAAVSKVNIQFEGYSATPFARIKRVPSLAPGGSWQTTIRPANRHWFPFGQMFEYDLDATADYLNVVAECNESNNQMGMGIAE